MVNRLRLGSGLVLLAFVLGHFLNHILGLVSLEAMNRALFLSIAPWRTRIGLVLLAGALLVHVALALWGVYARRSLRMQPWEAAQLVLGLLIPLMLANHVIGTRVVADLFDVQTEYVYVMAALWVIDPGEGALQMILLVVAWLHACVGVHYWLRLRSWYRRIMPLAYAVALLLPALALAGYVAAGFEVRALATTDNFVAAVLERARATPEIGRFVSQGETAAQLGFLALVAAVFGARWVRPAIYRRRGVPQLTYPGGRVVEVPPGATVLEVSRAAGVPHAAVCGGHGRCSTCRVRLGRGAHLQPPPSFKEQKVLNRIDAAPNVRLACQLRPTADLEVTPLLPANARAQDAAAQPGYLQGQERQIAILFADMRAFTALSDTKLPYDVVFVMNRYFEVVGHAIENAGGRIDKFIGDGVMALFGVEVGPEEGCRQALAAARTMSAQMDVLNAALHHDLPEPLRIAIGIHVGRVVVGEMGYGQTRALTAIGNAVNIASRLEGLAKSLEVELVFSEDVAIQAGLDISGLQQRDTKVRGRAERLNICMLASATNLPSNASGRMNTGNQLTPA